MHKSGFVNIIGNPNVGKSTLMNALVGERLSIITSKAQTTRHRIMGIVNGEDFQIVYSDTPGILKPAYKLQESMMNFVHGAVDDADVILYVTDTVEQSDRQEAIVERINRSGIPTIVVINKIDLLKGQDELIEIVTRWKERLPNAEIFPTSAKEHFNVKTLMARIVELLPECPPYFGKDALTDKPARFFVTEIIREDTHDLFGFFTRGERELFLMLMTVSGIGANTARMIMSAYSASEIRQIIATGNARALSQVKGLGPKTAQRIIVDLGDKIMALADDTLQAGTQSIAKGNTILCNEVADEATQALTMLGFSPAPTSKVVHKILSEEPDAPVEKVIKLALKML